MRLVDTHDHVLSTYDRQIAIYATEQFQRQGIELVMGCRVCLALHSVLHALFFMHSSSCTLLHAPPYGADHPCLVRCMHSNIGAFILDTRTQMWTDYKCAGCLFLAYPDDAIVPVT